MFAKGDLVFVPSDVTLVQFDHDLCLRDEAPNRWFKTERPSHALFAKIEEGWKPYCKIYYEGQYWFTKEKNIMSVIDGC